MPISLSSRLSYQMWQAMRVGHVPSPGEETVRGEKKKGDKKTLNMVPYAGHLDRR